MKLFGLLFFVGLAAASSYGPLNWQSGKSYTFDYSGRLLTGLPELANHYSGVGITCQVELNVQQDQRFVIKIQNAKFVRVNNVLQGNGTQEGDNWRQVNLPPFSDIPEESRRSLEQPTVFKYQSNGQFQEMIVDQNEQEWSVNFKKALIALFQTKYDDSVQVQSELESNRINTDSEHQSQSDFWKTREQSLDGLCDVLYQVNELPEYMIKERSEKIPNSQLCPQNSNYYEIVKTRDINSCVQRTSFSYYKPGFYRCPTGNCEGMWTRSSTTRYVACGSSRRDLRVQYIYNEGELQQNLLGFKTEKFLTGSKQELRLIEEKQVGSHGQDTPSNPVTKHQLFYEYGLSQNIGQQQQQQQQEQQQQQDEEQAQINQQTLEGATSLYKILPRSILANGGSVKKNEGDQSEKFSPRDMIPKIKKLFHQLINEDLVNFEGLAEKQVTMKTLTLARGFSILEREDIRNVYHQLKSEFSGQNEQGMFKNIFVDTILMGGSSNNILFVKELIQSGELSQLQISSFFTFLPHYVVAPTRSVMRELFELVTSSHIRQQEWLYNRAIMGFSTLVQRACLAENRETSYPTFVFGEFCQPDSDIVLVRWIPFLQQELQQAQSPERRNVILVSLGLLNHKNVIPVVAPYLENNQNTHQQQEQQQQQPEQQSSLTRSLAVYALGNVARRHPNLAIPMLFSVFNNQAENTQVRIAAFNVLLRSNPSTTVLHKIASQTWQERDEQVLQVVNTAFFSLNQQQEADPLSSGDNSLQRKVWLIYPLIRKTPGQYPTSGSIYSSEYLRNLGIGYTNINSWIGNQDSVIPSDIYQRMVYYIDRYQFTPLEMALRVRGGENLLNQILDIVSPSSQGVSSYETESQVHKQLHKEWRKVIEQLKIKTRESSNTELAVFLNLFEDTPMFYSFQSQSENMLREKVSQLLQGKSSLKEAVEGMRTTNFQKVFDISPSEFSIPSEMGLPIVVEIHMPVTVSLRGNINVDWQQSSVPRVQLNVKAVFASQMAGWVGTVCPFTNEYTVTGIDEHAVVAIPAQFNVDLNLPEGKLDFALNTVQVNNPIDILHFHIRPFTVYQKLWTLEPMTLSHNINFIKSRSEEKTISYPFGDYLGLGMRTVIKTESAFADLRTVMQKLQLFNNNPLNMARFGWASGALDENNLPSLRKHEIQLRFDPSSSSTKEIRFQVQMSTGVKQDSESSVKVHKVQQDQQTGKFKISLSEPQHTTDKKIEKMMENIQVQSGAGLSVRVSASLKGRVSRTWTYVLTAATGMSQVAQKWNLHLESENGDKKICINGKLNWPSDLPVWKMSQFETNDFRFHYENVIGFGRDCQESKITIQGNSESSEQQKKIARESPEAKLYKKLHSQNAPMTELSEAAQKYRDQLSRLDKVNFAIQYNNVPRGIISVSEIVNQYLKSVWWANLVPSYNPRSESRNIQDSYVNEQEEYKIQFNTRSQTFDLTIRQADRETRFQHIRIPYPLNWFFPLSGNRQNLISLSKNVVGKSFFPQCMIEGNYGITFDNRSTPVQLDECYHLLAGDCSARKEFGILIRESPKSSGESLKDVKIYIGMTSFELTTSDRHSRYSNHVSVRVNGTDVSLQRNSEKVIRGSDNEVVARLTESQDGVVTLRSQYVNVVYDGYRIQTEASYLTKNRLCGLCGDLNDQKLADLRGPKKCVYSEPEVFVASYRLPECQKPLSGHVQQKLQKETEECSQYREIPTRVYKSFQSQTGNQCTIQRHELIQQRDQLCFSRKPVTECSPACKPEAIVEKRISFGCMPESNRLAQRYAKKVLNGEIVQELAGLEEAFKVKMDLPRSCVSVNNF